MITKIQLIVFSLLLAFAACAPKDLNESSEACSISSGDILVSNSGSDAVLILNSDGSYKNIAYNVVNSAETVYGLAWSQSTNELLVAVDGVDRVVGISATDCSSRNVILNPNLTGNIRGLTQLSSGDILIVETNNIERFTKDGFRVTTGGWPKALQTAGTNISATASGGFSLCSTTTDVIRTYDDSGTQLATLSSGIAGTTDGVGCMTLANGSFAAVWSGTTDSVKVYDSALSTEQASYSNTAILSTPGGIAQRSNGNLLVIDRAYHYIVELTLTGEYVGILGDGVLSTPEYILVAP